MNPPNEPGIKPFPKSEPLVATHLQIVCQCSDGKLRAIQFEGKQAKKVYGYLEHIQGGRVKMKKEPVLILNDTDLVRQAVDAAHKPPEKLTFWRRLGSACASHALFRASRNSFCNARDREAQSRAGGAPALPGKEDAP